MGESALVLGHTSKMRVLASHFVVGKENRQNKPPRLNSWRGGGRERGRGRERERGRGEGEERGGVQPGGVILSVLVSHDMCVPEPSSY